MLEAVVFGVLVGFFSSMIDDYMYPDMILSKYYEFVKKLGWIGKPFGGCIICLNFWIATLISFFYFDFLTWIGIVGVSNFVLHEIIKRK